MMNESNEFDQGLRFRGRLALAFIVIFLLMASVTPAAIAQQTVKPTGDVELVQDGFEFTEGPAWDEKSGTLFFTDIPNTTIHQLHADGKITAYTKDSKHTNGILIPTDGRMLGCQMDGQVVHYDAGSGAVKILASTFEGKRFNAPNDLTIDAEGGIYFTDPLFRAPQPLPQTAQAVYYVPKDGEVSRVTGDLAAPNGIGLSIDGKRLYVCPSKQSEMLVYDVTGPGKLANERVFCEVTQPEGKTDTGADGITLDVKGNVYITTHLGVEIFSPEGKAIGLVTFPEQPANVCFGGADWKTMFVTARHGLYKVQMPIEGFRPGNF